MVMAKSLKDETVWCAVLVGVILTLGTTPVALPANSTETLLVHESGQGITPDKALVRLYLHRSWSGVMVEDQYVPQPKVDEVSEFTGAVINSSGYVVSFIGEYWTTVQSPVRASIKAADGTYYPANLLGIDKRLSLVFLKSDLPEVEAIRFSADPETPHLNIVARGKEDWQVAAPCVRKTVPHDVLPVRKISATGVKFGHAAWGGSIAVDLKGHFVGVVTEARPHGYTKKLIELEVLPSQIIEASLTRILSDESSIQAGWLGVNLRPEKNGIRVLGVDEKSPAWKAGVKLYDLIERIDGRKVTYAELIRLIRWKGPGATAELQVVRAGEYKEIPVKLGQLHQQQQVAWAVQVPEYWTGEYQQFRMYQTTLPPVLDLGFVVDALTGQLAKKLQSPQAGGLLVKEILSESPAEKAGFQAGDVLIWVNGHKVFTVSDIRKSIESAENGLLEIRYVRDGLQKTEKISRQR
jgi:serine protease Do